MKSAKQKREEFKTRRKQRAQKLAVTQRITAAPRLDNSAPANHEALAHNNTYGLLPLFYVDKPFTCRDCGKHEVWTATQQKWWYEVAKGHIDATAVLCRTCRWKEQQRKVEARRVHLEGRRRS